MVRQQTVNQALSILGLAGRFSPEGEKNVSKYEESKKKATEHMQKIIDKFERGKAATEAAEKAKFEEQARQSQYSPEDWVKHFEEKKAATSPTALPEQARLRDKEQVQQYKESEAKKEFEAKSEEEKFYLKTKKGIMGGDNNV